MSYTTLEYDGVEKSLAGWGIAEEGCVKRVANLEADTFRVAVPMADVFDEPIWPFEGVVIIRSGRASATGLPDSFSGGAIEFQGKRLLHVVDGRPDFEGVFYNFAGPWYDVHNCPYQQLSAWWLGVGDGTGVDLSSDVLLFFQLVDGHYAQVTTKVQIFDALQHVLDQYALQGLAAPFSVDLDDVDVNVPLPTYPMQDVKCSEVIEYCLRPSPDARVWFDYSVSPPAVRVMSQGNCTPVTVALGDGVSHESLRIVARPDLQARSVVCFFKQTNRVDDASWQKKTKQKHGPHGADSALDPDGGLRVLVQTVDLQGFSVSNVYGELVTLPVTNDLAFWQVVVPELRSTQVRNFAVLGGMTVVDDDGNVVSLAAYPNALMDGSSICPWMTLAGVAPITGRRVTITADVTYKLYNVEGTGGSRTATNGQFLEWFPSKRLSWRGIITNGITDNYTKISEIVSAEEIPTGLAEMIYTSLATLQYEGDVSLVQAEISGGLHMGNTLNLSGGVAAWATMGAQIQSIAKDFGTGKTVVEIGPSKFLAAGDLTQLFLINRLRRVYQNPSARVTGRASGSDNSVSLGKNSAKENSNTGLDQTAFLRLLYTHS